MTTRGPTRRWSLNYPKIFQNKCAYCGKIISSGFICSDCRRKQNKSLRF